MPDLEEDPIPKPKPMDHHFILNNEKFYRVGRTYANRFGIQGKKWNSWNHIQPGDFIYTDDYWVVKLLRVVYLDQVKKTRHKVYITSWGYYDQNFETLTIGHMERPVTKFITKKPKVIEGGLTPAEKACIDFILNCPERNPQDIYNSFFEAHSNKNRPRNYIKFMLKDNVMNYLSSKVSNAMKNAGVTEEWWMSLVKNIASDPEVDMKDRKEFLYLMAGLLEIPIASVPDFPTSNPQATIETSRKITIGATQAQMLMSNNTRSAQQDTDQTIEDADIADENESATDPTT
jgi:hypothetical protein